MSKALAELRGIAPNPCTRRVPQFGDSRDSGDSGHLWNQQLTSYQ